MKLPALLLTAALAAGVAVAADWPQFRGPDRTDVSRETGLLRSWPPGGPKLLWTFDKTGIGYSGPSVVGDRLYLMGGDETKEYLFALDVRTGKKVWTAEVGPFYENNWGGGPRGTPTVDGDRVYALGGRGDLICVKASSGEKLWSKNYTRDLGGPLPTWGFTESPLVDGDQLLCTPGGAGGTVAALDKTSGKLLWRSKGWTDRAAYPSVVISNAGGVRQYVQMTERSVAGVEAKSGRVLWHFDRPARIVVPTPVCFDDYVYVTSGYGAGCNLLKLTRDGRDFKVEEVYANKNMQNHHGGVVLVGGHLYGYYERNDWVCQDARSGKIVWKSRKLGKGSLTCANGQLYLYGEADGTAVLLDVSTKGWSERGRFKITRQSALERPPNRPGANIWTHPVVANGRLYLRDQEYLFCFDVKAPGK
jgi:outer membrane protein assembly factor BamB